MRPTSFPVLVGLLHCCAAYQVATTQLAATQSLLRRQRECSTLCMCSADPINAFHNWLSEHGVELGTARAAKLPSWGTCLVAGADGVESGDTLLSIPSSLHLSPATVKDTPLGAALSQVIPADDDSAMLALGLLQEMGRGEASAWWPYLEILPKVDDMSGLPLLWPDAERSKVLAGSHLDECVGSAKAGLLAQWAQIEQVLPSVDGNECPPEVFNAAGYLWAHAIVLTRALPFGETLSLIPFLDLANHIAGSPNTCSIGVAGKGTAVMDKLQLESLGGEGAAVLTAGQSVAEGEQIFIDYGESGWRSSWEMLYTYGFVPGSEPQDFMAAGGRPVFFEGISPTDPLMPQKQALLVALGADESAGEGVWVDLQVNGAQSAAMAPLLRLKHLAEGAESMDEAGRAMVTNLAAWQADPTLLWTSLQKPVGAAIEAKVAHQVRGVG